MTPNEVRDVVSFFLGAFLVAATLAAVWTPWAAGGVGALLIALGLVAKDE